MAKQTINLGTSANKGDGDPLRTAFDKVNDNFDELYARDLGTDPESLGVNLAPSNNGGKDLGTATKRWGTVYVRDFIDIGNGSTITVNADGEFVFNKPIISNVASRNDIVGSLFGDDSSIAFNAQTHTFFGQFDGDVTGSVYADNSTILVDGVNGTISASALTGALPAIDGSALTGLPAGYTDSDVDTHLNTGSAGSNEVLSWTGTDYDWVAQSSGGSQTRSTKTGTTSSLADDAEADLDITGFKSYALLTITTDRAARVRLYVSAATRTADASRAEGTDPTSDAGLIAEVITTGAETVIISPGAFGFNNESTPTTTIPCRVTNKSGSSSTVQVDLNILQLEA